MPRLFVAIRVPANDPIRSLLDKLDGLRGVKPVEPENLHYTLRFLGDVSDEQRDALVKILSQAEVDVRPFDVHICGTSAFPGPAKPSVVWLGCTEESDSPMKRLADAVDGFADEVGLGPRDKPFVPHLTLARVKRRESRDLKKVVQTLREAKDEDFGPFLVDRVSLVESALTDHGPVYTDIAEVRLS